MVYELPSFPNDAYVRIRLREVSLFTGIADYHTWEVDNFVVYGKPPLSLATDFDTVAACNEGLTWIGSSVQARTKNEFCFHQKSFLCSHPMTEML